MPDYNISHGTQRSNHMTNQIGYEVIPSRVRLCNRENLQTINSLTSKNKHITRRDHCMDTQETPYNTTV